MRRAPVRAFTCEYRDVLLGWVICFWNLLLPPPSRPLPASRSYAAHACPVGDAARDTRALPCPDCNQTLRIERGEDTDAHLARHLATSCRGVTTSGPRRVARCPVSTCKTKLTTAVRYTCPTCRVHVCLKHRFPEDHDCRENVTRVTRPQASFFLFPGGPRGANHPSGEKGGGTCRGERRHERPGQEQVCDHVMCR